MRSRRELAGQAVAVALARAETTALLSAAMLRRPPTTLPFPPGGSRLSGDFDREIAGRSAAEAELWYRRVARRKPRGRPRCRAHAQGPHRSDLDIVFAEKDMPAALSSTGEQKALLIGLILAHAELVAEMSGMTPILLLDEVAAHLDPGRRAALFERLAALGCQTFMTGTDSGALRSDRAGRAKCSASPAAASNRRLRRTGADGRTDLRTRAARLAACRRPAAQSAAPQGPAARSRSCRRRSRSSSCSG